MYYQFSVFKGYKYAFPSNTNGPIEQRKAPMPTPTCGDKYCSNVWKAFATENHQFLKLMEG
jgi:hypothetical protein